MRRGFTWIELLVILLVLLVAGLLAIPVFLHVREASWRARCLSQLRSLSGSLAVYASANDGRLPIAMPADELGYYPKTEAQVPAMTKRDSVYWANAMEVEVESLICPVVDGGIAYAYNGYLQTIVLSEIADKKTTISFWEGFGKSAKNVALPRLECVEVPCEFEDESLSTLAEPPIGSAWTHGRGANFLFMDGHAAWRRLGEEAEVPTDPKFDPFHRYNRFGEVDKLWLAEDGRAPLFKP
ncbi:MAG: hypothetical protein ABIV13_06470 [Fimbriimonadales bacterium]